MATAVTNEGFDVLIEQPNRFVKVFLELFEFFDLFKFFVWSHSGLVVDYHGNASRLDR